MTRWISVLSIGLLMFALTPPVSSFAVPYCSADGLPTVEPMFASLQGELDNPIGDPSECAHPVLDGALIVQHVATGALVFNLDAGDASFTDGTHRRKVAVGVADLPNGGSGWSKLGEDVSDIDRGAYSLTFGKNPTSASGLALPDPIIRVIVLVAPSIEEAQAAWRDDFSKLGDGERPGTPPPLADDQTYGLLPSIIDVRVRDKNVVLQAVELTSGEQPISLDDTVGLVRVMVSRVNGQLR